MEDLQRPASDGYRAKPRRALRVSSARRKDGRTSESSDELELSPSRSTLESGSNNATNSRLSRTGCQESAA